MKMKRPLLKILSVFAAGCMSANAGLTIIPIFDSSITGDPNAATIESSINAAIATIDSYIANNVTVNITFQETSGGLGSSMTYFYASTYGQFYTALQNSQTRSAVDNTAIASLPNQANNPVNGNGSVITTGPLLRALGFNANPPGSSDTTIILNTSIMNLSRSSAQNPNYYDLQAVAMHEIANALGIGGSGSQLGGGSTGPVGPLDLFRYSAAGVRSYAQGTGIAPYFSINGGTTDLVHFNQAGGGSDYSEWGNGVIPAQSAGNTPAQAQDAFGLPGTQPNLGANEMIAFDVIGYNLTPAGTALEFSTVPVGAIQAASTVQTTLPTYGNVPTPPPNKDSLVVITHGWIDSASETIAQGTAFVDSMSNSIAQYLANNGLNNWQVQGYKWPEQAYWPRYALGFSIALHYANQQGKILGDSIVQRGWTNVHFIAHSAGAGLIQKATEVINSTSLVPVTIHCTFLDAYDGLFLEKVGDYGNGAAWADSYFSRDLDTGKGTEQPLFHAFNVDVTTLDPQASQARIPGYVSSGEVGAPCYKTESSHGWPIDFYSNTITGNVTSDYHGFGFSLSEEAGNWDFAKSQYPPGNGTSGDSRVTRILGPEDPSCSLYVAPATYPSSGTSFPASSTVKSTTGTLQTFLNALQAATGSSAPQDNMGSFQTHASPLDSGTGSPVWIATVITATNALNFLSFDMGFTSAAGSHGLFSVYWDTNMIGLVDEAAVQPGLQHYALAFPNATANTSHVLGFHLDPFASVQSSITITNITMGYAGVSQPPVLTVTTNMSNGLLLFQLSGQPDNYTVQATIDLTGTNWTDIAILANTTGTVNFVDSSSTNYPFRFYRALAQ